MCVCSPFYELFVCVMFFFFKQKTAYEMRIRDWSSDVCSSDLATLHEISAHLRPDVPSESGLVRYLPRWFNHGELKFNPAVLSVVSEWLREIGRASCRERVCQYV